MDAVDAEKTTPATMPTPARAIPLHKNILRMSPRRAPKAMRIPKSALFREAPEWFHHLMAARPLLKWAGGKAANTRPEKLGDMTLSMLRGEEGFQARELDELIAWLRTQPKPDVICLSNALLVGMARKLKSELGAAVVCMLQGEVDYLDALLPEYRAQCWKLLSERAK